MRQFTFTEPVGLKQEKEKIQKIAKKIEKMDEEPKANKKCVFFLGTKILLSLKKKKTENQK